MMGRKRSQQAPQPAPQPAPATHSTHSQQRGGGKNLVGVRLMQEPGFAAHDSHLYRRRVEASAEGSRDEGMPPPLAPHPGAHHLMRLPSGEIVHVRQGAGIPPGNRNERIAPPVAIPHQEAPLFQSGNRQDVSPLQEQAPDRPSSRDNPSHRRRRGKASSGMPLEGVRLGTDFRHAVSRLACPVPQPLIKALAARENVPSIGKVHVSLRVTPSIPLQKCETSIISLDKKRRQVTILEPKNSNTQDRVGVSAPKMFAFDQVYSHEDDQNNVVGKVLPDILQAVLGGTDGCVMCFGGSGMGKTHTMVGSHLTAGEMGIMPTAISWIYQAIAHLKANKAARFSVRVSAVVVDAPGKEISDVLGDFAQDNETSPGALLRQGSSGLLSSVAELRAPFPETAARYLDLALSARSALCTGSSKSTSGPTTLLFTLHIYQYTIDRSQKGRVLGGRSRLHLIDLGDMSGSHGESLSLSGLTSVLLAIFNGHKYLPHKFNRLTQLLQEILGSVTCHAAMIVHVSASHRHSQHTLATLQLASRVHRLRRKKIRGLGSSGSGGSSEGSRRRSSGGETSAGSSSLDFSSSEQSADTVIYIGGGGPGDSSDGEHPPIFFPHHIRRHRSVELPRLRSFEQLRPHTASPHPMMPKRPISVSPTPTSRSVPSDKTKTKPKPPPRHNSTKSLSSSNSFISSPIQSGFFRHQPGVSHVIYPNEGAREPLGASFSSLDKESAVAGRPTVEGEKQANYKFYQEPNTMVPIFQSSHTPTMVATSCNNQQHSQEIHLRNQLHISCPAGPHQRKQCLETHNAQSAFKQNSRENLHQQTKHSCVSDVPLSDEHWIDGPRISKSRINAAKNKLCQSETWVDGPSMEKGAPGSYGFMDDHKKTMIERWVEIQTAQVVTQTDEAKHSGGQKPNENQINDRLVPIPSSANTTQTLSIPNGEELNLESDVDTLSEEHSGALPPSESKQPNLIEELERKNLIPVHTTTSESQTHHEEKGDGGGGSAHSHITKAERPSEEAHVTDDPSVEDVCSQCEALAEECEELNSLLSCEEDECKRQVHNGLATVLEEPELESAFGGDDPIDSVSLLNNPQTDCEDADAGVCSEVDNAETRQTRSSTPRPKLEAQISHQKMVDNFVQVCEEDILRALSTTPCPSDVTVETSDDHPLRVLSEENLTCASTFTDSCSQIGETGDEDDSEDESRPFSLFEATEYGRICQDLTAALQSEAADKDLRELANIHRLFSAFTRNQPSNQPESLFNPVLFGPPPHNKNQPKSLPANSSIPTQGRVSNERMVLVGKGSCVECNANSKEPSEARLRNKYSTEESLNKDTFSCRYSMDKCTGTDDNHHLESNRSVTSSSTELDVNNSFRYYHSAETLINDSPAKLQNNFNSPVISSSASPSALQPKEKTIPPTTFDVPKYISDPEHNLLLLEQVSSFGCKSCEDNFKTCDNIRESADSLPNKYDNDSDCPSSVSEDSEYIIQNSKFSKFLCVGIGRSKSKTSVKSNKVLNNKNNSDSKKTLFKIRDTKSKVHKNKDLSKSPHQDSNSKNLVGSPSRILPRSEDGFADRLEAESRPQKKLEGDPKSAAGPERGLKCHCANLATPSSPQERFPSRLEFCPGTSSSSASGKDWGASPLPLMSPQLCPDVSSGAASKSGHPHPMTTSGSLGTTQSLGESSGYESIPRDSECSSFSSSQESEMDEEHRKFLSQGPLQRAAGASAPPAMTSSVDTDVSRVESIVQNSFLKHLTKKSSSKAEAKLVSSTTWKYRCW